MQFGQPSLENVRVGEQPVFIGWTFGRNGEAPKIVGECGHLSQHSRAGERRAVTGCGASAQQDHRGETEREHSMHV